MSGRRASWWGGEPAGALRERWGRDEVYLYGSVGSTMEVARRLAEEEAPGGTIVLAREQTEGRGRAGRTWHSPQDAGVYLSMIFRPGHLENPEILPVLAGLGVARSLDDAFPGLDPGVKWPNDLMAGGDKLGGVLAEAVWGDEGVRFLVVGVGVNVRPVGEDAPDDVQSSAASLEEVVGEEVALVAVADAVVEGLEVFLPDAPPRLEAEMLELVDRYDWLRDRRVRVRLPDEEEPLPGVCVGIAPDGRLLFRPDRGALRRLDRGEVVEVLP